MAIFVDHQAQFPKGSFRHDIVRWNSKGNILAVGSFNDAASGGEVNLFLEQGEPTRDIVLRKPTFHVSALAWHPEKYILAVGWSNGELTLWNQGDKLEPVTVTISPKVQIIDLVWSSNGFRLLIADAQSTLVVYKIDHRGSPHSSPFCKNTLNESIRSVILKPPPSAPAPPKSSRSHTGVATLGVAQLETGDALDMFSRSKTGHESFYVSLGTTESSTYFIGGAAGGVFCLRESGSITDCFKSERPVLKLLYFEQRNVLVTVTEDMMLHQHSVTSDCKTNLILKAKLTEKPTNFNIIWTKPGILAMSSGENRVRLWDLENEENCVLTLTPAKGYGPSDNISSINFCPARGVLGGGTSQCGVGMWRWGGGGEDMETWWKLQAPIQLPHPVLAMEWAPGDSLLALTTTQEVFIIKEQSMLSHFKHKIAVTQSGRFTLAVTNVTQGRPKSYDLQTDVQLKGLAVTEKYLAAWDSRKAIIFELEESSAALVGNFVCNPTSIALYGQNVYVAEAGKVQVRTFQGTVKQTLPLAEEDGDPLLLDVMEHHLVVGTSNGFGRVFDLSRREAKQQFHSKNLSEGIPDFGSILSIRVNSQGNKVSYMVRSSHGLVNPKLFVWDAETDSIYYFNFATGLSDQFEFDSAASADSKLPEQRLGQEMRGRIPELHCWDSSDPRLLTCQAMSPTLDGSQGPPYVLSFFMTPDYGILLQDAFPKGHKSETLLGVDMPFIYFTRKSVEEEGVGEGEGETMCSKSVMRRVGREFVGLEEANKDMKDAMLNFSFHLTVGNMDEAFKAIKLIKSEAVWENMAHMCVKTQRLDVAGVCLGNMGHARGARQLRKVMREETQREVQVACLAIQLGLIDDAVRLYLSCGRFDLLNKLHQSKNSWKQATELAQSEDRIHMRNTFYLYAKHLESVGAVEGAIENYEKSDTHRFEIPRMLFDNPVVLEKYVKKHKDAYLEKWWAQYLESLGELETARNYYTEAKDYLSVVRICCYMDDMAGAAQVASGSGDEAACYHLARQYETAGDYKSAVHFFTKAQAYASAIRLAKEHGMTDQIAQLSLMSSEGDMIEAAKYYEEQPGQADKAVMLYHKAGMFGRALDLAFRTEQFSALDLIAGDLDENSDPKVLERCAEFFMKNQQYSKAIQLLAYAKQYKQAIELCINRNVPISEELVELLTPTKDSFPNTMERNRLLEELADFCMQQGHYHYAAKKYTQAGSKTEAMRALLKSGDTAKIISFANIARSKEMYIMAGNYLQTVNWKSDPDIMKQIVNLYTKGGAPHLLAGFYDACAQVEIDDYRDYEKALNALQEAVRCISKGDGKDAIQIQERIEALNKQISLIKKFLNIRSVYEADPAEAMKQLLTLANEPRVNDAVRVGDIYAVLIIHNIKKENYKKAHSYLEELRKKLPDADLSRFVKPQIVEAVYQELNLPIPKSIVVKENDEDIVPESISLIRRNQHDSLNQNGASPQQIY